MLLNPSVTIVYAQSTFFPDVVNQQKSTSEINRYYRYISEISIRNRYSLMIDIDYYQLLLLYRLTTSAYIYPRPALVLHFAPSLCFTLSLQSTFYPLSAVCSPQSSFYTDRYQKSIDIIDINRFNPPINID